MTPSTIAPTEQLLREPLWRPDDLGTPIPDSPHAVSACLPTWADNIGYEEQDTRVISRLTTGYPRFVYNQLCRRLFAECERRIARDGEKCLVFPAESAARRCVEFVRRRSKHTAEVHEIPEFGVWAARFPVEAAGAAKAFWQHSGIGISSRQAAAILEGRRAGDAFDAQQAIRTRVANCMHVDPAHVWLFPTGMAAMFSLQRVLQRRRPEFRSVQFGFPYVDSLKILESFGAGVHFFPRGDRSDLEQLSAHVESEELCAIYTELPANPLLTSPDLTALSPLAREADCPLVVDDTVASCVNVDVLDVADVVWSSLTKFFSGVGDVTGGGVVINPDSPHAGEIARLMQDDWEDTLWPEDVAVLEQNSRDFPQRVHTINRNAEALADMLHEHPRVAAVHYPKYSTPENYAPHLRSDGGYGGLLSLELIDPERNAPRFYDALRVCKGPNLGMNYTLACPFTILAHYGELDFAERCGVSRWLIRVSVGMEPAEQLIARFADALDATPPPS
ncbi:MAG: PLP-dependent transferase [Planctomycetota bacterium]|nr:MAG: PLP-dependent transferase [Planctomycetota bacterium]